MYLTPNWRIFIADIFQLMLQDKVWIIGVTANLNPNNTFKLVPVLGSFCFPLAKHDSRILKDCIFQWISIDCQKIPLDSYS